MSRAAVVCAVVWVASSGCGAEGGEPGAVDADRASDGAATDAAAGPAWVTFQAGGGSTFAVDGLFQRPPGTSALPAVIYNHGKIVEQLGYEGAAAQGYDVADFVSALAEAGYVALAPLRPGTVTAFSDWRDTITGAVAFLKARPDVDPARIFLAGYSKGGLLTLQVTILAGDDLAGVVLMSPAGGESPHGWTDWATDANLLTIDIPVLVTIGSQETGEIPTNTAAFVEDMARLGRPVDAITFDDPAATHDWFHQVRDEYWPDILAWLDVHAAGT